MAQMGAGKIARFFKVYIMPAAVLQSVMVGGGYGTGREVVEFVTSAGPKGGGAAIGLIFVIWAVLISISFELARMMATYNYRHFLKGLIGPAWLIYEALAIVTLTIVLAVVLSASSQLIFDATNAPKLLSVLGVICAVAWIMRYGLGVVEGLLSVWAGLFSAFLVVIFLAVLMGTGLEILTPLSQGGVGDAWISKGGTFAFYNVALIPVLLYTLTEIKTRTEAFVSGVIAAAAGILPAVMMHLIFLSNYPAVLSEPLPMYVIVAGLGSPIAVAAYFGILLGTIVLTAVGALEGIVERVDGWLREKGRRPLRPRGRLALAGAMLTVSAVLSSFGVIGLVARGYGTMAWGFLAVYVIPVLTIGVWRIVRRCREAESD